ncbi:DUF4835 family protein [Flavobacterium macrobrachii]|jgi:hypothetical protein|uniref:DUF4835 family protein n=1 Tax=Flavobacterium macrobrachii TaxID=591204 RepID=A0ABS2CU51_9FLAO|nr:DUF4835 family protein [Flavobacterium macrobrachii]MBM6498450.1 DUF4835 family protein [Flavobacterium macrobrachii]PZO29094.1 MAG: DUF4835 domain-containing protein [Flavobacteriaceae bacterium]
MKKTFSVFLLLFFCSVNAQQLNCTVQINTDKVATTNNQIFKNLQVAISDFVNKTDFTGEALKQHEKISCSMVIIINSFENNNFSASIQVQSNRPVFNSTYSTPVFNFNDNDFSFRYTEFENLIFNPATFESNLVSMLSFYSYIILGLDADTYKLNGGRDWLDLALQIQTAAQQGGYRGWSQSDGNQNRFFLINDILSGTFQPFRDALYAYHRNGLDIMTEDIKIAKENIIGAVEILSSIYSSRPNAFLTRVFFDAKSDEIVSVLSGGPNMDIRTFVDKLNRISPVNSSKWTTIRL